MVSVVAIIMHTQKDFCKSIRICKKIIENLSNLCQCLALDKQDVPLPCVLEAGICVN